MDQIFSSQISERLGKLKILQIGAGGIGCELLKNLMMIGIQDLELIDLDTIDITNLNRQFLFQKKHVGQSKSKVARESALKYNPKARIVAHHGNIMDIEEFGIPFFRKFDVIMNGLGKKYSLVFDGGDNIKARSYVNNMALTLNKPIIETGTAGYFGQTRIIIPGKTECYDCVPHEPPKTFAICTIRTTPSAPIHCIVWAKSVLLNQLFGIEEEDEEMGQESQRGEEIALIKKQKGSMKAILANRETEDFGQKVFEKIFIEDVQSLASLEHVWKDKTKPTPLTFEIDTPMEDNMQEVNDLDVWDLKQNTMVFMNSMKKLNERFRSHGEISFDKDDDEVMDFVTSASNLRSLVYGIERKSKFSCKSMAGNIIPAISTTNAIIAGLACSHLVKYVSGKQFIKNDSCLPGLEELCKTAYTSPVTEMGHLIGNEAFRVPNENCAVCSPSRAILHCNVNEFTFENLISKVIQSEGSSIHLETDFCINEANRLLYDLDFTDNAAKTIKELSCDNKWISIIEEESCRIVAIVFICHDSKMKKSSYNLETTLKLRTAVKELISRKRKQDEDFEAKNEEESKKTKIEVEDDDCIEITEQR